MEIRSLQAPSSDTVWADGVETGELNVRVGYFAGAVCAGGAGAEEVRCAAVWRRAVPVRHGDILVRSARMRPDLLRPPHHRARLRLALPTTGAAHLAAPPPQSRSRPCQPSGCWPRSHYILAHFLSFGLLSSFGPLSSGSPCPGEPCACKEACRGQCSPPPPTWSMPPVERPAHDPA